MSRRSFIAKIQAPMSGPGPALVYDQGKSFLDLVAMEELPVVVREALGRAPKVYWCLSRHKSGKLDFHHLAPLQPW